MGTFGAQIKAFADKAKFNLVQVQREIAMELFGLMSQMQPSVKVTGGTFVVGKVPVDLGLLIGTSELRINGQVTSYGIVAGPSSAPPDFMSGLANLRLGDSIQYVFTQDYARPLEYGHGNVEGRFFVRTALAQHPQIVARVTAKHKP